jgi:SAM-dependent methyltransferase
MSDSERIAEHYASGAIWDRLRAALMDDGVDPDAPSLADLSPYDQFHGRGVEATAELADGRNIARSDHLLDVGCGLGGPARYLADRCGCEVTGIDLTSEFCEVAVRLNSLTSLGDRVNIHQGSALDMPFDDGVFDGAYSMNVSMNIEDKAALYGEIYRVLRPGGWFALSEIAQGPNLGLVYPTAWAATEEESFLVLPEQTQMLLEGVGFAVDRIVDVTDAHLDYGTRAVALVEEGHKPPVRTVGLVHGDSARQQGANFGQGLRQDQIRPIEAHCIRPH